MEMTGRMEEAVQLFSSTLIEQIECGSATDISSLSGYCQLTAIAFDSCIYTHLRRLPSLILHRYTIQPI
jgi:hypothetical protein